ncbi:hypothetical protein ABIB70_007206 [Bradyrhizobium sp. F1.2.8]
MVPAWLAMPPNALISFFGRSTDGVFSASADRVASPERRLDLLKVNLHLTLANGWDPMSGPYAWAEFPSGAVIV